jgi:hypothetical protein
MEGADDMKATLPFAALISIVCAAAIPAHAADPYTFEHGDVMATLHETPCLDEKVSAILKDPDRFRAAHVLWKGEPFAACWTLIEARVVLVDETGDAGYLAPEGFRHNRHPVSGSTPL